MSKLMQDHIYTLERTISIRDETIKDLSSEIKELAKDLELAEGKIKLLLSDNESLVDDINDLQLECSNLTAEVDWFNTEMEYNQSCLDDEEAFISEAMKLIVKYASADEVAYIETFLPENERYKTWR